ncbi:hypothetical protein GCM10020256_01820 [Streptomyces thermocoprophilus]
MCHVGGVAERAEADRSVPEHVCASRGAGWSPPAAIPGYLSFRVHPFSASRSHVCKGRWGVSPALSGPCLQRPGTALSPLRTLSAPWCRGRRRPAGRCGPGAEHRSGTAHQGR